MTRKLFAAALAAAALSGSSALAAPPAGSGPSVQINGATINPTQVKVGSAPSQTNSVVATGDSLTHGYAPVLAALGVTTVDNGVPGQSLQQIAARVGALPTTVTFTGNSMCDPGGDQLTFLTGFEPVTNSVIQAAGLGATIAGKHGILSYSGANVIFTCDATGATPVLTTLNVVLDQPYRNAKTQLFWIGHNNGQIPQSDFFLAARALAANVPPSNQYAFLSNTYDTGSAASFPSGQFGNAIQQNNSWLQSVFGTSHYIDTNTPLLASYTSVFPPDATDNGNGIAPASVRLLDAGGTLTSGINNTTTSIPVNLTAGSSVVGDVLVIFDGANSEEDAITAQTGASGAQTLTVTRGFGGNTAQVHSSGVQVYVVNTIHYGVAANADTAGSGCIAAGAAWHTAFPSAQRLCGSDLIASTVKNWLNANPAPIPVPPTQTAGNDGALNVSAGVVGTTPHQAPVGTVQSPVQVVASSIAIPGTARVGAGEAYFPSANLAADGLYAGVPSVNKNYWWGCYVFSGSDYCTPLNGAQVQLGNSANPYNSGDIGKVSLFNYVLNPDTNDFGSVGTSTKAFGQLYAGQWISRGASAAFNANSCSASALVSGGTAGKFTSGTTGTCTVQITLESGTIYVAPNDNVCWAYDKNTGAQFQVVASDTTHVTISGTTTSGDTVNFACVSF